jgi:hypothetical protein
MTQYDDDADRLAEEDMEGATCKYCLGDVYWGDFYDAKGEYRRRLFNASNHRLHSCHTVPDPNAFPKDDNVE